MKALDNKAFNLFDLGLKKAGQVRLFDENATMFI